VFSVKQASGAKRRRQATGIVEKGREERGRRGASAKNGGRNGKKSDREEEEIAGYTSRL